MKSKQAALVINPRAGQNLAKMSEILAILAAAGWKTEIAIKEYGGHAMTLARKAAEQGTDLVIAYGGDGTVNQVINGVLSAQNQHCAVGLIPGGTANVWAAEIGVPGEPVNATLALIDSDVRMVDVGHIEVDGLSLAGASQSEQHEPGKKGRTRGTSRVRQHFLLMAGLGIDAAIMKHVSQPLKYRVGTLAVGVSTLKELPAHRPFPVEICTEDAGVIWQGEALQVVIGNTRLYANIVQMTPDAYIDDGMLDVCVITAGNPLTTMQQIASLLLRHQPDNLTAEHFHGAHFAIRTPASVPLQLDGSAMKLKKYLNKADRQALAHADTSDKQTMVTYHFKTLPHALKVAIPRTYSGSLFKTTDPALQPHTEVPDSQTETDTDKENEQSNNQQESPASPQSEQEHPEQFKEFTKQGHTVTIVGVSPDAAAKGTYIVAGSTTKQSTGETRPVAVRIDSRTQIYTKTGVPASAEEVLTLRAGDTLIATGKKRKLGAIRAKQIII